MFKELLEKLARALQERHIPYMIIGGQAVLLYGEPRLTKDIDITIGIGHEKTNEMLALAQEQEWSILIDNPESFVRETMVLPCEDTKTGIRIDFIFSHSQYESQALERVKKISVGGTTVCFASVEDLIIHKIIAGRPRDIEDVKNIMIKNSEFDISYIRRWLKVFEEKLEQPYVECFENLVD